MDIPVLPDVLINFIWTIVGFLIGNKLAIGRDKRKEFNDASEKVREAIKNELTETKTNYYLVNVLGDIDYIYEYLPVYYRLGYYIVKEAYKKECSECSYLDNSHNVHYKAPTCKTIFLLKLLNSYMKRR